MVGVGASGKAEIDKDKVEESVGEDNRILEVDDRHEMEEAMEVVVIGIGRVEEDLIGTGAPEGGREVSRVEDITGTGKTTGRREQEE